MLSLGRKSYIYRDMPRNIYEKQVNGALKLNSTATKAPKVQQ